MIRGTTPTITMKLPNDVSVTDITIATLSIQQVGRKAKIDKNLSQMTIDEKNNCLMAKLSQEDTLCLAAQQATNLQLKIKFHNETVSASYPIPLTVVDIINEEVI